jgi:hypothetical protein
MALGDHSIYYYDYNEISRHIPAFIEYYNKEKDQDYFVTISRKQTKWIEGLYSSLVNIRNIIKAEDIRHEYNSGLRSQIKFNEVFDVLTEVKTFEKFNIKLKVFSRNEILKQLESEKNLIFIKKKGTRVYMFEFQRAGDQFDNFMKFCNENIERQMYKDENYKIPLWIMFVSNENLHHFGDIKLSQDSKTENMNNESSQSANSTNKKLPNTHKSSDTFDSNFGDRLINDLSMISFEVKFILIESVCVSRRKEELVEKISGLVMYFIRNIDRKIMMKILKEKNICDERLFPKDTTISCFPSLEGSHNFQNIQNFGFDSYLSKRYTSVFKSQDVSFLDCQYECKFFSDYDIESVYKALLNHFEKNFKINNRNDIFCINQGEETFILYMTLTNEEKIKSFHNNLEHLKVLTNVNKFKQGLTVEDIQTKAKIFSKKHNVTINLYGLEHPSVNVTKIIRDLVNEKLTAVKLKYLASSLLKVESIKSLPDFLFLLKLEKYGVQDKDYINNAVLITEAMKQFTEKAKVSWNKLVTSPEEQIENHDIELISQFSNKLTLEHFFEGFIPLCEMNRNYFENFTEYYKIFKGGSIFSFIFNENQKILVMSDLEGFAFLIKMECNDYEDGSLSHVSYELLQIKEVHDINENLLDLISERQDIYTMIMRFLDDLLYVAYLLVITCSSGRNNNSNNISLNNSYVSSRSNLP